MMNTWAGPDFSGEVLSVPGAFSVLFGGETEDPARVEALLMEEIARLAREGVDEELFRLCKNQMYGELLAGLENVEDAATRPCFRPGCAGARPPKNCRRWPPLPRRT